ncbi:transmembrane protease serine 9-like [Aphis gossypii]|nr:transmembrane protease serine 9-like [Aphis gossypii]
MRSQQLQLMVVHVCMLTAAVASTVGHGSATAPAAASTDGDDDATSRPDRQDDKRIFFDDIFGSVSYEPEEKLPVSNCTCNCGVPNQEIRIVGGRPTGVHRYPWVAKLMYEGHFHCGGSLINSDYVLTAAHCVRKLKKSRIRVIFGDHDQSTSTDGETITRMVSSIVRHRNFDVNSYNHDVALLRLRKAIPFTKSVRPICLPSATREPSGKVGTVVGWGRLSEGGNLADVVQEVQVPILSLAQCRASKYRPQRITANMICAGKGVEDSCQGDSGGPLLINSEADDKLEIVGIVSWGVGCGRPGYPGVYTRVTKYLDWIQKNMRDTCAYSWPLRVTVMTPSRQGSFLASVLLVIACAAQQGHGGIKDVFADFGFRRPTPQVAADSISKNGQECDCSCGSPNVDTKIVGGEPSGVHEYPWMVRLSYFNQFYCGGTLINDRYVLTAAHCVKGFFWPLIKVTFGEHDYCNATRKPETRFVLRSIVGEFSYLNFQNDLALLRLNDRVPMTATIKPVCLPTDANDTYSNGVAKAAGWGTLYENGSPSCHLRQVDVPIVDNEECAKTNYTGDLITENMICAGHEMGGKDSCQGDSGGPLMRLMENKRFEIIGIVSWGHGCARPGYPGVYTRVAKYLPWIKDNTKEGCYCSQ